MFITLFVVVLAVAIMFHEFGHYITAKAFGMKVDRFFMGFGPTLWSVQRGETEYGIKAIPAGGFVRIVGMTPFEDVDPADAGRTFYEQSAWKRLIVLCAGSATHFLLAAVLLFMGFVLGGLPVESNEVGLVSDDSPAAAAGLAAGDVITAVDGEPVTDFGTVRAAVEPRGGETVTLRVERDGQVREFEVAVAEQSPEGHPRGFVGLAPADIVNQPMGAGAALASTVSGEFSVQRLTVLTVEGLGQVLSPQGLASWFGSVGGDEPRQVDGFVSPVGIGQVVSEFGQQGHLLAVFLILAQLNIVIGLLNMAPLPPLDGGHVAVLAVEESVNKARRLFGRAGGWRLNPAVVTPVALLVILGLSAVFVTALYLDIVEPITDALQ